MILLELLLCTARCYGHAPRVEHAWGGAEAEAVAAPFVLRRVSGGRGVDLLRAVQLLAELGEFPVRLFDFIVAECTL